MIFDLAKVQLHFTKVLTGFANVIIDFTKVIFHFTKVFFGFTKVKCRMKYLLFDPAEFQTQKILI